MYIYAKRGKLGYFKFILVDIICILLSFCIGYYMRQLRLPFLLENTSSVYTQGIIILILAHICVVYFLDMYVDVYRRGYFKEFIVVLKQNISLMFAFLIYFFMTKQAEDYSRKIYVYFFAVNIIMMYVARVLCKSLFQKVYRNLDLSQKLYVITNSEGAAAIVNKLLENKDSDYEIKGIAIVDCNMTGKTFMDIPVVANKELVYEFARLAVVDSVFIHLPGKEEEMYNISEVFIDMGITVHINIEKLPYDIPNKTVHNIGELTVVSSSMRMATPAMVAGKRAIDISGALLGLILTGIAMIFIGPIIYLESPGPIFFKQKRVGRNGRVFTIYKFRSMYMDAEERKKELMSSNKMKGFMFKMDHDPRITKVGAFIRKTSIDELPQFLNVLKGDMSLVGTRPPTVDEYKQYELRHKKRLSMKPGLTGIWQVSGRSNIVDFEKIVQMDADYISNWSIGMDMRLILKTVGVLFGDRNAS